MTRQRIGFTLIELLVVVVVLGILAAIAIPKFAHAKARTRAAAIKSDLRNLATAQEEYLSINGTYADDPALLDYTSSEGVIVTIVERVPGGWSATTHHPMSDPFMCAIYYGTAASVSPATQEGTITCAGAIAGSP